MPDYYTHHYQVYHNKTFWVDPAPFLHPLITRLNAPSSIVDVGCGSGRDILWLQKRGYHVIGLERSSGLAGLARKYTGCRIVEADFENYDFAQLAADALLLIGALVHLPHPNFTPVLDSICRALKKDGFLLITMKHASGTITDQDDRRFYRWQDKDLRRVFQSLNLTVLDAFNQPSIINPDEVWLGYVLKNT